MATIDQTRTSCLKYVRQLYAQANMSLRLVGTIRQVPAPVNMFAVADGNGQRAAGGCDNGPAISRQVQVRGDAPGNVTARAPRRRSSPGSPGS